LTISREYSRVLGGEIMVESKESAGSTFTLYLPLTGSAAFSMLPPAPLPAREQAPARLASPADAEAAPIAGRKILVVEDDARNLYAITTLLEKHDATVFAVASAREAFAALDEHPDIELVLMDIMMPDIDGLQATRQIRATPKFAELPVVALTAKASESDRAECQAAGLNDYVVKPAEVRQLLSVIARNVRS
jgi:CheY-like chemotaxis protein